MLQLSKCFLTKRGGSFSLKIDEHLRRNHGTRSTHLAACGRAVPPNVVEQGHALDVEFTDEAMNKASRALDNIASVDPASPKLDDIARNAHDILALISPEDVEYLRRVFNILTSCSIRNGVIASRETRESS